MQRSHGQTCPRKVMFEIHFIPQHSLGSHCTICPWLYKEARCIPDARSRRISGQKRHAGCLSSPKTAPFATTYKQRCARAFAYTRLDCSWASKSELKLGNSFPAKSQNPCAIVGIAAGLKHKVCSALLSCKRQKNLPRKSFHQLPR